MKHITRTSILSLTIAAALAGCGQEAAPPPEAPTPSVAVVTVAPEEVTLTRELPGRTVPHLVAEVRPQVTGIVKERLFTEGSLVEAGQPLYQLDDAIYQADYRSAKASLERAQAAVELSRINSERTTNLFESNAVSRQEFDNATANLQQAEAELAVAEAALVSAQTMLAYSQITSPISGRIGKSSVTQGALVTANQQAPLATVQQLDPIYVDVNQSSSELLRLRRAIAEGNLQNAELPVKILLEDDSVYEHPGKVAFADVTVDPSTGSFSLRVLVPNPDHLLLPGMYVRAVVGEGIRENGILVPQKAVSRGPSGNTTVMVVRENNTIESRAVVLGQSVGNQWLVESGLLPEDRVVTEGIQKIRPEMQVQIADAAPAADSAPAE